MHGGYPVSRGPGRSGVSLIEALMALAAGMTVVLATGRLLASAFREDGNNRRRLASAHASRDVLAILSSELETLSAPDGDILSFSDSLLVIRAVRAAGEVCAVHADAVVLRQSHYSAMRAADPVRDSILIYLAGDPPWREPRGWRASRVNGTGSGLCADGSAGVRLDVTLPGDSLDVAVGAPARVFEPVEYRAYRDGSGDWWLGMRTRTTSGWAAISPVAGPLAPRGLRFTALDSAGSVVESGELVAAILTVVVGLARPSADSASGTAPVWP
jgi:hypothetical protein